MKSLARGDRFSPTYIKTSLIAANRVVIPAMASQSADENGFVTQATLEHYQRLTQAGAGVLIVEYSYVHRSGRSESHQLGIDQDAQISGLTELALLIKKSGAIAGFQLTHSGAKTARALTDGSLMGPSAIAVPVKDETLETPTPMTDMQIQQWIYWFVKAAGRAKAAGFDFVELHSAHGYGLNQWLSPVTNQRRDLYGGPLLNRLKLLLEIIKAIQTDVPGLAISVRFPGKDFLDEGLTAEDCVSVAKALEGAGVSLLNVSSGIGGWRRPRDREGQGYLLEEAQRIQSQVNTPVIGVGGIETGSFIDQMTTAGLVHFAAVGRAILKDPSGWGAKNLSKPLPL